MKIFIQNSNKQLQSVIGYFLVNRKADIRKSTAIKHYHKLYFFKRIKKYFKPLYLAEHDVNNGMVTT